MIDNTTTPNPGETRTKRRQRNQIIYILLGAVMGGVLGFLVGFFDQGDGNLFSGDWDALSLDPTLAIVLAAGLLLAFLALPLWGFRMIDEHVREHNLIAFTGGSLAVLSGFPAWALLYAGGWAPAPHAFGIWAIGFVSMGASYLYARFR